MNFLTVSIEKKDFVIFMFFVDVCFVWFMLELKSSVKHKSPSFAFSSYFLITAPTTLNPERYPIYHCYWHILGYADILEHNVGANPDRHAVWNTRTVRLFADIQGSNEDTQLDG